MNESHIIKLKVTTCPISSPTAFETTKRSLSQGYKRRDLCLVYNYLFDEQPESTQKEGRLENERSAQEHSSKRKTTVN
jgi:hypothetical protein